MCFTVNFPSIKERLTYKEKEQPLSNEGIKGDVFSVVSSNYTFEPTRLKSYYIILFLKGKNTSQTKLCGHGKNTTFDTNLS